jgi:hypothetical protein
MCAEGTAASTAMIAAVEAGELDGILAQMGKSAVMTKGKKAT